MVVFTCNACGESLKRAHVEKHVNMCRGCKVLSCIDCGKDFWGDEYKSHIKCISEDQKYGGKGYEAKPNKGEVKQQQWIQKVHDAMNKPGINSKLKDVLKQVSAYDNIPRKKAKFENWMRNSLKISNSSLHNEVWEILSTTKEDPVNVSQKSEGGHETEAGAQEETNTNEKHDGQVEVKKKKLNKQERREARKQMNGKAQEDTEKTQELEEERAVKKKKKNRKRALECEDDGQEENGHSVDGERSSKKTKIDQNAEDVDKDIPEQSVDQTAPKGKFNWKGNIKAVLKASPDQELSIKKVRKKVLAAYYSFTGDCNFKTEEEVLALFNKKISSNPKFRVLKERVRLVN